MAEFNSSAFSAVDSFFVIDKKGGTDDNKKSTPSNTGGGPKRRVGVGATKPVADEATANSNKAAGRLMKVGGKKRGRHGNNEDDDDDDEEEVVHSENDDDEEELGRTGIVSEPTTVDQPAVDASSKPKKKKKKGKKERQLQKEAEEKARIELEATTDNGTIKEDDTAEIVWTEEKKREANAKNAELKKQEKKNRNGGRTRPKIRSRQKNIYKDNRTTDQKPDHLLPGGYEYKGRPMTKATQSKVVAKNGGLPASEGGAAAVSAAEDDFREVWDGQTPAADSGVPVGSSEGKPVLFNKEASNSKKNEKKATEDRGTTWKEKKNKPKSKYKNL